MDNLNEFMPHGFCIAWNTELLILHVVSDILIAIAYFSIPIGIVYVVRKKPSAHFQPIYYLFAGFILACGVTHVMGIVTLWVPLYYAQGWSKAFTAVISVATALFILSRLGRIMTLPNLDELTRLNEALASEIQVRSQTEESLRKSEQAALNAQRTQAAFLANMSHEIRTPMNGVIGGLDLLKNTSLSREQYLLTSIARQSAHALLTLLNDILDISKVESGKLELREEETDLLVLIEEVGSTLSFESDRKQIELVCPANFLPSTKYIADPVRVRQILMNLVGNAIKFTETGHVALHCQVLKSDETTSLIEFVIEDTGIGICEDEQRNLFKRFKQVDDSSTRRASGTGLGLAIVKELVTLMKGEVTLESVLGQGTRVRLTLPLRNTSKAEQVAAVEMTSNQDAPFVYVALSHPKLENLMINIVENFGFKAVALPADEIESKLSKASKGDRLVLSTRYLEQNPSSTKLFEQFMGGVDCLLVARSAELADPDFVLPAWAGHVLTKPVSQKAIATWLIAKTGNIDEKNLSPEKFQNTEFVGNVMVVEDALMNQMIVSAILGKFGVKPVIANNGQEALTLLETMSFDLILMDGQMPVMDGYEATRRIRLLDPATMNPNVPIVALTAHAMTGEKQKCEAAGMNGYLTKPIVVGHLVNILEKYLKKA